MPNNLWNHVKKTEFGNCFDCTFFKKQSAKEDTSLWVCKSLRTLHGVTYFFIYKPSGFFSIWHKSLGDFFTRNGVWLIAEDLRLKTSRNLMMMWKDCKFHDCSALFVTCFKIVMTTTYFWPQICFPRIERRSHSTRQKFFSFHITNEIFGLSTVKTPPLLARLVQDTWEWNGPFLHVLQTS